MPAGRPANETRLDDERRDLAGRYFPLAKSMSRDYRRLVPGRDDEFESAACYALFSAAQTFDASRGAPFHVHARRRIKGELDITYRQLLKANGECASRNDEEHFDGLESRERGAEERLEHVDLVGTWLGKLGKKYEDVCRKYMCGLSFGQIAEELGISRTTVDKRLRRSAWRIERIAEASGVFDGEHRMSGYNGRPGF